MAARPDAVVVGSGPNGLAAALTLAEAGLAVEVHEGAARPGGGCRTEDLTLRGFHHDVCAAVHPLVAASPFFGRIDLEAAGVELRRSPVAFAHPLDDGRAAAVGGSVEETAASLGEDGPRYRRLMGPLVEHADAIVDAALGSFRRPPSHPGAVARFASLGLLPATVLAGHFRTEEGRALVAGAAAHAIRPLGAPLTAGFGLLMTLLAHQVGWPVAEGGSARVTEALVERIENAGGRVLTGRWVETLASVDAPTALLDLSPRQVLRLGATGLPARYRRALAAYRFGPGICKVDWALAGPVPWTAPVCREAVTVHLGGSLAEIVGAEREVAAGIHPERPYAIVVQPGVVDPTRAPAPAQTLWAYCHVPRGSMADMTARIERQLERFAPGFGDLVLDRVTATAFDVERENPNYVGGDINGGAATLRQTLCRPTVAWNPYRTPTPGLYLCSASTPPGGGVHGMCGLWAARTVLGDLAEPGTRTAGVGSIRPSSVPTER